MIAIKDLNVKGMVKNRKLSKHTSDASWGNSVHLLQYKCDWYGRELVKVDRFFPSSKTCNVCGRINQDLNLLIRAWTCNNGHILYRDHNVSVNTKTFAQLFWQADDTHVSSVARDCAVEVCNNRVKKNIKKIDTTV